MGGGGSLGKKEDGGRQRVEICSAKSPKRDLLNPNFFKPQAYVDGVCVGVAFFLPNATPKNTHTTTIVHNMKRIWPNFTFIESILRVFLVI